MKKLLLALLIASSACRTTALCQQDVDCMAQAIVTEMTTASCGMQAPVDCAYSAMMEKIHGISRTQMTNPEAFEMALEKAQEDQATQAMIAAALLTHRPMLDAMAQELQAANPEMCDVYTNVWPTTNDVEALACAATEEVTREHFEDAHRNKLIDDSSEASSSDARSSSDNNDDSSSEVNRSKFEIQEPSDISSPEISSADSETMRAIEIGEQE